MSCGGTGILERYCTLAELNPAEVVQHLLNGSITDGSLRKVPGYVAYNGAPLLCASLGKVCGAEGQQEASNAARQAGLQREEEHEQHLRSCHHAHQVPFSAVSSSCTSFVHSE